MGTTLTGTTPQDTYDSLIKVTDNGPLSGTAKYLSDGLGNDSILALSTSAVGVGTASPQGILHAEATSASQNLIASSGNATFRIANSATSATRKEFTAILDTTNNRVDIQAIHQGTATLPITLNASGGNVGIGTTSVTSLLTIGNSYIGGGAYEALRSTGSPTALVAGGANVITRVLGGDYGAASTVSLDLSCAIAKNLGVANTGFRITAGTGASATTSNGFLTFSSLTGTVSSTFTATERLRLDSDGLKFNGDTAAANALDDYEEGTWTVGVSFGGASVGVTTSTNTGTYTKVGRQVTVNGYLFLTSKGSSTGIARITGLPFTVANSNGNLSSASLFFQNITFSNQFQGYAINNTQQISLEEITILGATSTLTNADFADNSGIIISLTYFV